MDTRTSVTVQGQLLPGFIEDGGSSAPGSPSTTETDRPRLFGPFVEHDTSASPEASRDFIIVLKDPRQAVTVRGTGLRYIPFQGEAAGEAGSSAVVVGKGDQATVVALVRIA